ncbi:hypothetical protein [Sagittula sp. S175]|uniref:hypothetical protein n=1 Tax=Sagittula sp. S175 TaxID=3415129 RepID=UPI003C7B8DE2
MADFFDQVRDEIDEFAKATEQLKATRGIDFPVGRIPVLDAHQEYFTAIPAEDLVWQGRWFRIERWTTSDWTIGFGHLDGVFEIYALKWVVRFEASPPEYR